MAFSVEGKNKVVEALTEKGAILPCPRCGNSTFSVLDGYFMQPIQEQKSGLFLGGKALPSAVVVCGRCGYLSHHALGVLGLLEGEKAPGDPREATGPPASGSAKEGAE